MRVVAVDFRTRRHKTRAKDLLGDTCRMIEGLNCEVAGYALCIWTDDGTAATVYQTGGIVSTGAMPSFVNNHLVQLSAKHTASEKL